MESNKVNNKEVADVNRRNFLKNCALLTGAAGVPSIVALGSGQAFKNTKVAPFVVDNIALKGELLYNGIQLPEEWPPRKIEPDAYNPMPLPYLQSPPEVILIDVGRQLFVDDFLIEKTDMKRQFHQPDKYTGNPILKPEKEWEMNDGYCPVAAPFSDGVFYDPKDKLFKLWYMAGWYDNKTGMATSSDGFHWERPKLDVVPGTNLVLQTPGLQRDGVSIWLDHDTTDPLERFKMYMYVREGKVGGKLREDGKGGGYQYTSPDGIHWVLRGKIGATGDNSTFFYNPFRKVWVFTVRRFGRAAPPWSDDPYKGAKRPRARARSYWENRDFLAALDKWQGYEPVFWLGADKFDHKRPNYPIGYEPQLYKVDAVAYESLMIGFLQPHYGPPNEVCAKGGFPKLTELQLAFSRDGFHWDRSCRETFIGATLKKNSWERAYIHSIGGICNIVGDNLHFYYTAFKGDESKKSTPTLVDYYTGMYANGATGVAVLRRDGFASMDAGGEERMLYTRPLKFTGRHLFLNLDGGKGKLYIEVCDENGTAIPGFTRKDFLPVTADSTKQHVTWKDKDSLQSLVGKPVRLKIYATNAKIYAFWISKNREGVSGGATAAGGPGFSGTWDI